MMATLQVKEETNQLRTLMDQIVGLESVEEAVAGE